MFDKQELTQLGDLLNTLKVDMRDELQSTVQASENRILQTIAEILHVSVLTQIDNLEREVTSVKAFIKMA